MPPTFPRFAPLTLEDKDTYDDLIKEHPPLSNISFAGMHIWWNLEGHLAISSLNGNLIINYHLPFDTRNSGYSLIGKHDLDSSIATIFKHLRKEHRAVKLVHVPEFVIEKIKDKSDLDIAEEDDYNEYILDSHALATLEDPAHGRTRRKVGRFSREVEGREVELKPLDLSSQAARDALFEAILGWEKTQLSKNDPDHTEHHALKKTLDYQAVLGIENLGLYIDGKLSAIVLYNKTADNKYYILNHLKVDYSIPYIFDYMTHHIAKRAVQEDIHFINMEMDLGIENLRRHKMGLRPVSFFKQYRISSK
ncbi:MAG TPA: phosphatidylglycerol lysyltransferase domain-containing protein [Candidatus Saccharimonadales bacterium]|nr:phosphatidylglycerol lysyltransferase domain-containing protein [Candidatus Saccharimonadales bacterium]